jgi:hypothetical protein
VGPPPPPLSPRRRSRAIAVSGGTYLSGAACLSGTINFNVLVSSCNAGVVGGQASGVLLDGLDRCFRSSRYAPGVSQATSFRFRRRRCEPDVELHRQRATTILAEGL